MDFEKILRNIENIAKLKVENERREAFKEHLRRMVEAFEKLKDLNTEGVEPLINPIDITSPLREDMEVLKKLDRITALNLAPDKYMEYFKAPSPIREAKTKNS